jgi:hypothetical protein
LRNEKTGANGIRSITQQELNNLQAQYGHAQMPIYMQKALAANTVALAQRNYDMMKTYADYRAKGMRPTDADQAVLKDPRFSQPLSQITVNPTAPEKIPKPAILQLKANPQLKPFFDAKYGAGSSDWALEGK